MKIKISILADTNPDSSTKYVTIGEEIPLFPICNIGKDSYIVEGNIYIKVTEEYYEGFACNNLHIGHFCSIGQDVSFHMGDGHNYRCIAMGVTKLLENAPFKQEAQTNHVKGSIIIQNDVWIGTGATIMQGVTVHNGAVIAANAHVVKDVPPYAIVGGNPAQVIGYRFEHDIIEKLQIIQWWYWTDEKIKENAHYFSEDVERFCNTFYAEALSRIEALPSGSLSFAPEDLDKSRYLLIPDFDSDFAAYTWVIDQFIERYSMKQEALLILYVTRGQMEEYADLIEEINKIICMCQQNHIAGMRLVTEEECSLYDIFRNVTHYIMTRNRDTVQYTCIADHCGVKCISGVDKPVCW